MIVFSARVCRIKFRQLFKDGAPSGDLLLAVIHMRERLSVAVVVGNVGEVLPPGTVLGVREARVVGVQLGPVRQDLVRETVQVTDTPREPRDRGWN